jgi:hypothetical protein
MAYGVLRIDCYAIRHTPYVKIKERRNGTTTRWRDGFDGGGGVMPVLSLILAVILIVYLSAPTIRSQFSDTPQR